MSEADEGEGTGKGIMAWRSRIFLALILTASYLDWGTGAPATLWVEACGFGAPYHGLCRLMFELLAFVGGLAAHGSVSCRRPLSEGHIDG